MDSKIEVTLLRNMDRYSEKYLVKIDGKRYEFTGKYYDRLLDPSDWQWGLCPVCGNVSGRTNIDRSDFCFCLEHRTVWQSGSNCFGDQKAKWYDDNIKKQICQFLNALVDFKVQQACE